ncbi:hypothetical protein [Rubritalea squalenifaciens]|nr:hypothetical protein [Rubritalea squalenifaciens]
MKSLLAVLGMFWGLSLALLGGEEAMPQGGRYRLLFHPGKPGGVCPVVSVVVDIGDFASGQEGKAGEVKMGVVLQDPHQGEWRFQDAELRAFGEVCEAAVKQKALQCEANLAVFESRRKYGVWMVLVKKEGRVMNFLGDQLLVWRESLAKVLEARDWYEKREGQPPQVQEVRLIMRAERVKLGRMILEQEFECGRGDWPDEARWQLFHKSRNVVERDPPVGQDVARELVRLIPEAKKALEAGKAYAHQFKGKAGDILELEYAGGDQAEMWLNYSTPADAGLVRRYRGVVSVEELAKVIGLEERKQESLQWLRQNAGLFYRKK